MMRHVMHRCWAALLLLSAACHMERRPPFASCANDAEWIALLQQHAARYPLMQPADAYKLLLHAILGSEHAVPSAQMANDWLQRELAALPAGANESLVDTLGTHGRFARVHLRPFVAEHHTPAHLADAFVATAEHAPRDTVAMRCALSAWERASRAGTLPWNADSVHAFAATQTAAHFPAVHHSAAYEAAYGPAYRVISIDRLGAALAP